MSNSLNSFKGVVKRIIQGSITRVIKGDTRNLDSNLHVQGLRALPGAPR